MRPGEMKSGSYLSNGKQGRERSTINPANTKRESRVVRGGNQGTIMSAPSLLAMVIGKLQTEALC
jgi:hypothetical protein